MTFPDRDAAAISGALSMARRSPRVCGFAREGPGRPCGRRGDLPAVIDAGGETLQFGWLCLDCVPRARSFNDALGWRTYVDGTESARAGRSS